MESELKRFSRFADGIVVETFDHPENPHALFDPSWDWIESPSDTLQGATLKNGKWKNPAAPVESPPPEPTAPVRRKKLTPPEFKLQFAIAEMVAIKKARRYSGADNAKLDAKDALDAFFDLVDDPRLTEVDLDHPQTIAGVGALAAFGLVTSARVPEILAGVP